MLITSIGNSRLLIIFLYITLAKIERTCTKNWKQNILGYWNQNFVIIPIRSMCLSIISSDLRSS